MSVEILHDAGKQVAAFYCTTTDTAFGPVFTGPDAADDAESLLAWFGTGAAVLAGETIGARPSMGVGRDPREWSPSDLERIVGWWRGVRAERMRVLAGSDFEPAAYDGYEPGDPKLWALRESGELGGEAA